MRIERGYYGHFQVRDFWNAFTLNDIQSAADKIMMSYGVDVRNWTVHTSFDSVSGFELLFIEKVDEAVQSLPEAA